MKTLFLSHQRLAIWLLACGLSGPAFSSDSVSVRQLPEMLHALWDKTKPEMNENSRCAAAFDGQSDPAKMVMRCSVYMRMGAEAAPGAGLLRGRAHPQGGAHALQNRQGMSTRLRFTPRSAHAVHA